MVDPTTLPVVRVERPNDLLETREKYERVKNLLGKFLDAWNVGEDPSLPDIEEARLICLGSAHPWRVNHDS